MGNPVDAENGAKQQTEFDYLDPSGLLTFARTYNSRHGGFTHNFMADFLPPKRGATGSCALLTEARAPYNLVCAERVNADGATASLLTAEQHAYRFSWDGSIATPMLSYNKDRLVGSEASGWTLSRTKENQLLTFSAAGQLQAVTTVTGRRALLGYSGEGVAGVAPAAGYLTAVTDNFGRRLQFHYGDMGHLERLVDPTGLAIQYVHEDAIRGMSAALNNASARVAHPSQVTFQDGRSVSYAWSEPEHIFGGTAPHANLLTGIVDANGDRFATFGYDTNGRAISTEHAGSANRYSIADGRSSAGAGPITVTDPLGSNRTWQFALAAGLPRITGQAQPGGSGCAAANSALTYDINGNIASKTDFNGVKSCHAYDLSRNLETARIDGLGAADACPADIGAFAIAAGGSQRKTTTQWHPAWSLPIKQAEAKKITISVYNGQPDPTAGNATASCAPTTALLPDGSRIAMLCKKVEQATADATGSLGFSATAAGTSRTWTYTYNQHGQVLTAHDPLNKLTTYAYYSDTTDQHTMGDLQSVTDSAGRITQYTRYDKSGRLMQSIDANGSVTDTTYTPRGWVKTVTVTAPGAAAQLSVYDYDGVGQLKKATLPDGSALEYTYDAAHRLTSVKDTAGNSGTYTLDNMGNRTGEDLKDPSGSLVQNITRVYDVLNRMQSATGTAQ